MTEVEPEPQLPLFEVDAPERPMSSQLGPDDPWPEDFF